MTHHAAQWRCQSPRIEGKIGDAELGGRSYRLIQRGAVEVKGKGSMNTYWLEGRGP